MTTAEMTGESMMTRPLAAGGQIAYWQLGALKETRYDVADTPMSGEMDPFFFVTKHKNFIPHEYACRTQFAAERRGRRPQPQGAFVPARNWLPFGSPRVDLSGFWFRPTHMAVWARTSIIARTAGMARLRLATCGGAVLSVNGAEAGWMAPYSRNLEAEAFFDVSLVEGENEILLWFDDLAERDARYYFQLDYLEGPAAAVALAAGEHAAIADAVETALADMHFEQPSYTKGDVALTFASGLPVDADVAIGIEGDFMSTERFSLKRRLAAGRTRLSMGDVRDLPGDFRHFNVAITAAGFTASRVFGVELCDAASQGPAPGDLPGRIDEALGWVAENAEADSVRVVARLATGRTGAETEAMIDAVLPAIQDCHDCADFILVPLLWSRILYKDGLSAEILSRIDSAILNYRYWMDEPGNDVQWYFSENHALLFHTAAYLAGDLLAGERFKRSQRLGREQSAVGAARVRAWLDHFEQWEMAEFNSAPYFPIDLKGLTALYALAPDKDIAGRAGKAIQRLLKIVAHSAHHGILTAAQGRSYEHTLRAGRSLELSGIARMLWGKGNYGRRYHALPQLSLCIRDHGLEIAPELAALASVADGVAHEWAFAQGQDNFARLYHYKTADHAMGSAAHYRWRQWGYQETVLHLRLGRDPDAQIWLNHPGETIHSGYGRPSYWGGCGTLPRVHQYRGLAIALFDTLPTQPDFTHAWFPRSAFDAVSSDGGHVVARKDGGCVVIKGGGVLDMVREGPTAGNELRQHGLSTRWIVRVGAVAPAGDPDGFGRMFGALEIAGDPEGTLTVQDPEYGPVAFHADGSVEAEGRRLDPALWTVEGSHATLPDGST